MKGQYTKQQPKYRRQTFTQPNPPTPFYKKDWGIFLIIMIGFTLFALSVLSAGLLGDYLNSLEPKRLSGVLVSVDSDIVSISTHRGNSWIERHDLSIRLKNNKTTKVRTGLSKMRAKYLSGYQGPITIEYSYSGLVFSVLLRGSEAIPWFIETDWLVSKKERPRFFPFDKPIDCIKQAIDDFDIYSLENQQACKSLGINIKEEN
ncbi:hypothetical protein [Catenovulum maritimum]|uniref:Uncharacterized protein n=1 Tax=Catenovulum maritimum TaxID=1513271 RepID=A0A0J8GSF3_9ALTE|nr:hypothetical protein [Catenovulum maritimum]KMT65657.1 hypothetical protein XM47_08150 [Catenovulum maritimum]